MPGQKDAKKDERRAQILRAGYSVASRVGLDHLTVRLVAAKAGLSSGLVLFYFKTKERLLAALLTDVLKTTAVMRIAQGLAAIQSPLARLRSMVRAEMVRLAAEPRRIRLFFEYWVKGFRRPEIRTRMRKELRAYRAAFRPAAEAVLASEPDRFPHLSAAGITTAAVGVIEGYAVQAAIDPGKVDIDEYLAAAKGLLAEPGEGTP